MHVGVADDAARSPSALRNGLPKGNADILDRVMLIDMQVAFRGDLDVDQRMARQLIEHMIEKADSGRNFAVPVPSIAKFDQNVGLFGRALDLSLARHIVSLPIWGRAPLQ